MKRLHRGQRSSPNRHQLDARGELPAPRPPAPSDDRRDATRSTRYARGESPASRPTRTASTDAKRRQDPDRDPAVDRLHRGRHAPHTDHPTTETQTSWPKHEPYRRGAGHAATDREQASLAHRYRPRTSTVRTSASFAHRLPAAEVRPAVVRRCGADVAESTRMKPVRVVVPIPSLRAELVVAPSVSERVEVVVAPVESPFSVALPRDSHRKNPPPTGSRTGANPPALRGSRANDSPFRRVFPPSSRL